jgi:hypothetical protein
VRVRPRLKVVGPDQAGGYDLFLDDQQVGAGFPVEEAARYVRDAWLLGVPVHPEHVDPQGGREPALSPDLTRSLQALGALPAGMPTAGAEQP